MFSTPEQDRADTVAYQAELVRRRREGLPLTKADRKDADRLIALTLLRNALDDFNAASVRGGSVGGEYETLKMRAKPLGWRRDRHPDLFGWATATLKGDA